jgi:CheY-like chemotaxis protein
MSAPLIGLPLSAGLPSKLKNKRVLLVDTSTTMRDRRAESMRKLGMEVDCAADISEARSWWRADLYSLVLIDMESGLGHRDKFCDDIRRATPQQQISFLVGKPGYLANAPNADEVPLAQKSGDRLDQSVREDIRAALAADLPGVMAQRWGILEASRRISAVRSLSHARSRATQDRPVPARDLETRDVKRAAAASRTLDDLLREELQ